jgi:hypothetical protein
MPSSFAPNEKTSLYVTKHWFRFYWPLALLGLVPLGAALSSVPDIVKGNRYPYCINQFLFGSAIALGLYAIGWRSNRKRLKWIRIADRGGIEWDAGGVRHRAWKQLVQVHVKTDCIKADDGTPIPTTQTLTVKFEDGSEFVLFSEDLAGDYLELRHFLYAKEEHAKAGRAFHTDADWSEADGDTAGQVTQFGPLTFHGKGLEWDGVYYSWDQIEGYDIQQGFLIIRTVDGEEFLKRTADLGDWRTAIARIQSRLKNLSAKKGKVGR